MPRWFIALCLGSSALAAFACNDETVEEVDQEVCYSGMRWVGEKRGSPEMYPGRDCVGCHIDNDGPPLAIGGTVYPYVLSNGAPGLLKQTGTDCFGVEGIQVQIIDADDQVFNLYTNRAGNFYVEGNPDDFAKPFTARVIWQDTPDRPEQLNPMGTTPSYGGCANCHNPSLTREQAYRPADGESPDRAVSPAARIGLPGNGPGIGRFDTIEDELNYAGCEDGIPTGAVDPANRDCEDVFERYGPPLPATSPQ
jgi:hypothetical protein